MKKFILLLSLFVLPLSVNAGRGCCSHHGGECGCSSDGRRICCDHTLSPTCRCTPPRVNGCTDYKADNYNPNANHNDGSCKYTIMGCTDKKANNYNPKATKNDGSCKYDIYGCKDSKADNYNPDANHGDGSCKYTIKGCTDKKANNYNSKANKDDGSCTYKKEEVFIEEKKNIDVKDENNKNDEDNKTETDNNVGTTLFYVTSFLGVCGYGVKKLVSKK